MAKVTFRFLGICSHVRTGKFKHRVVLINGDKDFDRPDTPPKLRGIPPHIARVTLHLGQSRLLRGVELGIRTDEGPQPIDDHAWRNRLPRVHIDGIDPDVIGGENPSQTAAYLDVDRGTLSICCHNGAFVTVLTLDNVTNPRLTLRRFGETEVEEWPLDDGAEVFVENASQHQYEDDKHFNLHYLIGGMSRVGNARPPDRACTSGDLKCPIPPYASLGPGCSNSDYP